jgi:cation diffusion facilitator CzcD-associated flavoprotein CzcO
VHDVPEKLLFRNYSKEFYPGADSLVEYLDHYRKYHALDEVIRLNTKVVQVEKLADGSFRLIAQHLGTASVYNCKYLLMAVGFSAPNMPEIKNIDMAETYVSVENSATSAHPTLDPFLIFTCRGLRQPI